MLSSHAVIILAVDLPAEIMITARGEAGLPLPMSRGEPKLLLEAINQLETVRTPAWVRGTCCTAWPGSHRPREPVRLPPVVAVSARPGPSVAQEVRLSSRDTSLSTDTGYRHSPDYWTPAE